MPRPAVRQDFTPKTAPFPHQVEAIHYLVENPLAALFDEQGLGKTKIVIDALSHAMSTRDIDAALIVAPLSLVFVWEQEVQKHSHLIPVVLRGAAREKRYRFLTGANFYITNYEAVASELERIRRFCKGKQMAIVLDEAARIKDPKTKTAQALFQLAPLAKRRVILTGTPVANKPIDVWAQFFFLDQGQLLGENYGEFCKMYNEKSPDYIDSVADLRTVVSQKSMRRTKEGVLELPEKTFKTVDVRLCGHQAEMYEEVREQLRLEIASLDGDIVEDEVDNILKRLLRLTQIASNPGLIDKRYDETPAKFSALDAIVEQVMGDGDKIIIWSSFVDNILLLRQRYRTLHPLAIYGDVPIPDRALTVSQFQANPKYRVLVANPSAAREGLTLTRANHAAYLDRTFNLVDYLQSQDRIHRISQDKRCVIYKIIARGTIDEYVDRILDLKQDIARYVQGDVSDVSERSLSTLVNKRELLSALGG